MSACHLMYLVYGCPNSTIPDVSWVCMVVQAVGYVTSLEYNILWLSNTMLSDVICYMSTGTANADDRRADFPVSTLQACVPRLWLPAGALYGLRGLVDARSESLGCDSRVRFQGANLGAITLWVIRTVLEIQRYWGVNFRELIRTEISFVRWFVLWLGSNDSGWKYLVSNSYCTRDPNIRGANALCRESFVRWFVLHLGS